MKHLLLIEWSNCDKTFESFQFLKDAKHAFESYQTNDSENVEYLEIVSIGETVDTWNNPDCSPEDDF